MSANLSKRLYEKLKNKKYRAAYVEENVRTRIAYQIRAVRGEMSQAEFGKRVGKPQSVVSRLEDPEYGKLTVQTLLEVADSLDIALLVKFVSFPEFVYQTRDVSPEGLKVQSFKDSFGPSDQPSAPPQVAHTQNLYPDLSSSATSLESGYGTLSAQMPPPSPSLKENIHVNR